MIVAQYIFHTYFVAEIYLRFYAHGWSVFYKQKHWGWNIADACFVAWGVLGVIYTGSPLLFYGIVRFFRVIRHLRVLNLARSFRLMMAVLGKFLPTFKTAFIFTWFYVSVASLLLC